MKKRILGIDPGSCITGFGIIEIDGENIVCITGGCIRLTGKTESEKLGGLLSCLEQLIEAHKPTHMAIESIFLHKNAQSALKLGQARGVALAVAMKYGLPVSPYAARQVKLVIVGKGNAQKVQVQYMVSQQLNVPSNLQADAADALAIALCHAYVQMNSDAMGVMGATGAMIEGNNTVLSRKRTARKRNYKWPNYQKPQKQQLSSKE